MIHENKTYGFTIAVKELKETVPNIFRYASAYKRMNNLTSQGLWEMFAEPAEVPNIPAKDDLKYQAPLPEEILSTEAGQRGLPDIDPEAMEGEVYNMCHFWSNFEIARLDWFRSKEYNDFFDMMDRSGGFWMERVSYHSWFFRKENSNLLRSGEMRLFIHLLPAHFWVPRIYTISVTLAIDTPRYSTALQTLQEIASFRDLLFLK